MSNKIPVFEHDYEPTPGLPAELPDGESILWQGRPSGRAIARRALKTRWFAAYFVLLAAWAVVAGYYDGLGTGGILFSVGVLGLLAAVLIGLCELYAWGVERTTFYTITTERVVMRVGVALSVTINLPFSQVESASHLAHDARTGDVGMKLKDGTRVSWLMLWPHARPFRFRNPEPTLRCVPDSGRVAGILANALQSAAMGMPAAAQDVEPMPVVRPVGHAVAAE